MGGGVLWLLGREQARLDEQTRAAVETRQAAVGARARLIAENVELLVGDVQSGLMATLLEAPEDESRLDGYLAEWKRTNPLVKATINHTSTGEEKERMARLIELEAAKNQTSSQAAAPVAQQDWSGSNASQVNALRNEFNVTAKLKGGAVGSPQRTGWVPSRESGGSLHLIGWRRLTFGRVIGVEVELSQIAARLGDVLPADREPGEIYELREIGGAVYTQKMLSSQDRAVSARTPLITVPVSEAVLPGWEVVGFLEESESTQISNGVLMALSGVLAGTLVSAILVGGTLLLRHARRSEEEAVQKISFVANVSHEFKTPLTTIRLYSELLEQGRVPDEGKRQDYLRTIGRETQRLARLVNNVLDFSRLEQGQKRFELAEIDLVAELAALCDMHAPRVAESGLTLLRDFPEAGGVVKTDRDAVGQIVINLIDNACKYAADGGEVTVSLIMRAGGGAEVRVSDRGPGVPAEHRSRIFHKFHRVDETLTRERDGAGLGLSIARQLARGMGGELSHSPRAGGGAEFILELP
ncbi:sensor histidine kinase [Rariglobus hedericola]|uniref:sensor histidine kinase n=1 Tax=Rariglobus hedericola TaxID=2597822 RepID=UPI001EF0F86D|nr:HAMP domain-containing sensor histidine kinase [Rariglobus hedericola]